MAAFLFGLECFAATLLWIALFAAWSARSHRLWVTLLTICLTILVLSAWVVIAAIVGFFFSPHFYRSLPFNVIAAFSLAATVSAIGVWVRSRRRDRVGESIGSTWDVKRLALAAIVVTLLAQSTLLMLDSQARDRLIDVRREGQALAQSLAPGALMDSENAAVIYRRVADAMGASYSPQSRPQGDAPTPVKLDDYPDELDVPDFRTQYWSGVVERAFAKDEKEHGEIDFESPRLKAFMERQLGLRRLLLEAGAIAGCNFNRDFSRPSYAMLLPEIDGLRTAARFLAFDALYAAHHGDATGAAENIAVLWRMADHVSQEPLLISSLVGFMIERIAEETMVSILGQTAEKIAPILFLNPPNRESAVIELERNMRFEEAASLLFLSHLDLGLESRRDDIALLTGSTNLATEGARISLSVAGPLARVLFLPDMAADARDSFNRFAAFRGEWNRLTPDFFERLKTLDSNPPRTLLIRMILPAATSTFKHAIRTEMQRRLLRVALGLYRYYHAPGPDGDPRRAFPENLSALVPTYIDFIPSDLFNSGLPLSFRQTETGCVVYSLGFNFADDQGVPPSNADGLEMELAIECRDPSK